MDVLEDVTWRFINAAPIIGGQAALDDLFSDTLHWFGVDRFDCVRAVGGDTLVEAISGRGLTEWNRRYHKQGYARIDPCVIAFKTFNRAYTWSDAKARMPELGQSALWDDARSLGMSEGLIVPTAPQRPQLAVVRLTTPQASFDPSVLPLMQSISIIYAASSQTFSQKAQPARPPKTAAAALTAREIDCLFWAARGKTNKEIAAILSISSHTVNTHIERAKSKLGVATRIQATTIAHQLGLLSIA
jgi:LuxR family quorum sensing-dependent transcriptional regulator